MNNVKAEIKTETLAGADANAKDCNGRTPLYWATYHDNTAMIKLFKNAAKGDGDEN